MHPISRSVKRKDFDQKVSGSALYTADLPCADALTVCFVRARVANAALARIVYPPLPEGYWAVDGRDLPVNEVHDLQMPVFPTDRVRFLGEPVAAIAGPDAALAALLAEQTTIEYADIQPPVIHMEDATEFFDEYKLDKGDPAAAFAEADEVIEETFETGLQEQVYLETQSMLVWEEGGVLTAKGSMQCPYYVVSALMLAFARPEEAVRVLQAETGGGFGGKEDYPSILATQVAAAAVKSGRPCRAVYSRGEDLAFTGKRHPARIIYRAAIKDGHVTAFDVDCLMEAGAYPGLTPYVLQRALFSCAGPYAIEHIRGHARSAATNTPSNGAFRGFGGPQAFFALETLMNHIARWLGKDPVAFKLEHLARQGDTTATSGRFHEPVPLRAMVRQAMDMSGYAAKQAAHGEGRHRTGIGLSMVYHGGGFALNGERDLIRARIRLEKDAGGDVTIYGASVDMGQGVGTAFPKIVAHALDIPLDRVHYPAADTGVVPDSGPTVASRSIVVVGRMLERATRRLKETWQDGVAQSVEECYIDPPHRIVFDFDKNTGDTYASFSWAVNVVEVSVDTLTGIARPTGVWAVFDCGTPLDLTILRGQAEGGILQGLGYGGREHMDIGPDGRVRQATLADYIIPTAMDAPPVEVAFYEDPYHDGPFGARGAGELTIVGAAPAYLAAVENALNINASRIPLTQEEIIRLLEEG